MSNQQCVTTTLDETVMKTLLFTIATVMLTVTMALMQEIWQIGTCIGADYPVRHIWLLYRPNISHHERLLICNAAYRPNSLHVL